MIFIFILILILTLRGGRTLKPCKMITGPGKIHSTQLPGKLSHLPVS